MTQPMQSPHQHQHLIEERIQWTGAGDSFQCRGALRRVMERSIDVQTMKTPASRQRQCVNQLEMPCMGVHVGTWKISSPGLQRGTLATFNFQKCNMHFGARKRRVMMPMVSSIWKFRWTIQIYQAMGPCCFNSPIRNRHLISDRE
jgi:hypothetical protein